MYKVTYIMLCPIFLDFESIISPQISPPALLDAELETITAPIKGPNLYALKIFAPQTNNQLGIAPFNSTTIQIPTIDPYKNKVRLLLQPSIGYGRNSCYKVEYWEYSTIYLPGFKKGRPSKTKCRTEYWRVSAVDGSYILNYEQWLNFQPKFHSKNLGVISLTKSSGSLDSLNQYQDVILINKVTSSSNILTNYSIQDTTLTTQTNPSLGISWQNPIPATGTTYQIEYVIPSKHFDLIFQDLKDVKGTNLPTTSLPYPTPYFYPPVGYPNSYY